MKKKSNLQFLRYEQGNLRFFADLTNELDAVQFKRDDDSDGDESNLRSI